jgi:hypothetical protein
LTAGYPQPWCPTCGLHVECRETGEVRPDYPGCHRGLRGASVELMRELGRWLRGRHGVEDRRVESVFDLLAERYRSDGQRYSEIFEPSVSVEEGEAHLLRFSYAFPGLGDQPAETARALSDLCRPFGDRVGEVCSGVCRALSAGCVEQPLYGLAHDGPERWRVKLYLQFRSGAGGAASRLAARILGCRELRGADPEAELHLLGLDIGDRGVAGAKLYFIYPRLPVERYEERIGGVELVDHLHRRGLREIRQALAIHRLTAADEGLVGPAREIDFALRDNGLLLRDLQGSRTAAPLFDPAGPVGKLFERFPVAVRRVSAAAGGRDRLNVYYMLTG